MARFQTWKIDGEQEAFRRVAIADRSGAYPENTDDGLMWIDPLRPFFVNDRTFSIPLVHDDNGSTSWTASENEHLFKLLRALRQPDVLGEEACQIICKPNREARIGARAIIKRLAMGVEP